MKQVIILATEECDKLAVTRSNLAEAGFVVTQVCSEELLAEKIDANVRFGAVIDFTGNVDSVVATVRELNDDLPVIFPSENIDVVSTVQDQVATYVDTIMPPFNKALINYAENAEFVYCTPGHFGGSAYNKSPVGSIFYDYFGENSFKADVSVSMGALGSLLDHSGPHKEAEEYIAEVANADASYIVTNGSSTSNKIVGMFSAPAGSTACIDRNCHKSLTHLLMMSDITPVYFLPTRNAYGMLGGIPKSEFTREAIAAKVAATPGAHYPDHSVITNSTYDGLLYKTDYIKENLDSKTIHFDSAWVPYTNFSPIYEGLYGMSGDKTPGKVIFETHSTHKLLAAYSQAATIHVKGDFDKHTFSEAYMMHTSTSPLYSVVASTEMASAMMKGKPGKRLMQNSIDTAIKARKELAARYNASEEAGDWNFKPWQPDNIDQAECWELKNGDAWHGFKDIDDEHMHLDPVKLTILTPGIKDDKVTEHGIPASVVAKYLEDHGIIIEKSGPYNILFLYSIGIDDEKSQAIMDGLENFKTRFDANELVETMIPSLFAEDPEFYAGKCVQEVAYGVHDVMKKFNLPEIMFTAFDVLPELEMSPNKAFAKVLKGETEEVYLEDSINRVQANMILPYPPGVPLVLPGEKITEQSKPVLDFLLMLVDMGKYFPGFDTDIHGAYPQEDGRYKVTVLK